MRPRYRSGGWGVAPTRGRQPYDVPPAKAAVELLNRLPKVGSSLGAIFPGRLNTLYTGVMAPSSF